MEIMTDSSTTVEDRDIDLGAPSGIYPMIDHAIRECSGRGLVSASEMMDILLDIRGLLVKEGIL